MAEIPGGLPRRRQRRSLLNDERILDAAVQMLDTGGWEEATLAGIAHQAGLTHPTVMDRYPSRDAAIKDAWTRRLVTEFRGALRRCLEVLDAPSVSGPQLLKALQPFTAPNAAMRASVEVILVGQFNPVLHEVVSDTVGADLSTALTPQRGALTRTEAARRAFVLSVALGSLIEVRRRPPDEVLDLTLEADLMAEALSAPATPTRLPARQADHLLEPPSFAVEDPRLTALLAATLDEVGRLGYEKATLKRIASAAGFTTGLIFARYDDKLSLFLDATDRMLAGAEAANHAFLTQVAEATSPGVAEATFTREMMRPDLKPVRIITYEQYRMSWHSARMQETFAAVQEGIAARGAQMFPSLTVEQVRARAFMGLARGIGMGLVADLHPPAWGLPHDVVTVPLVDS